MAWSSKMQIGTFSTTAINQLFRAFSIIFFLLTLSCNILPNQTKAIEGILDLRDWDPNQGALSIRGEWEFFWKDIPSEKQSFIRVPAQWTEHPSASKERHGYATYQLTILLPREREELTLYIAGVFSSYDLYWNGKLLHSNGKFGTSEPETIPSIKSRVFRIAGDETKIQLRLLVSNFTHRISGMRESPLIGLESDVYERIALEKIGVWIGLSWLLFLSFFNLFIFSLRKENKASLYLANICLASMIPTMLGGSYRLPIEIFSDDIFIFMKKIYHMSFPIIAILACKLTYFLYGKKNYKSIFLAYYFWFISYICLIVIFPLSMSHYLFFFDLISLILVFIGMGYIFENCFISPNESIFIFVSFVFGTIDYMYFILYAENYIQHISYLPILTTFLFVVPQTLVLTRRVYSLHESEKMLSLELKELNDTLETKIIDRTSELNRVNEWKSDLIQLVSHDLRLPLIGVKNIFESLGKNSSEGTLQITQNQAELSISAIQSALQMVKQILVSERTSEMRLSMKWFSLNHWLERIQMEFRFLCLDNSILLEVQSEGIEMLWGDETILTEVMKNLFSNAIKHSPASSKVKLWIHRDLGFVSIVLTNNYSSNEASTSGLGLGLKLSIKMIEAHQGNLIIKSELDGIAIVTIRIPSGEKNCLLIGHVPSEKIKYFQEDGIFYWHVTDWNEAMPLLENQKVQKIICDVKQWQEEDREFFDDWKEENSDPELEVV